jgi:hypothetical protein
MKTIMICIAGFAVAMGGVAGAAAGNSSLAPLTPLTQEVLAAAPSPTTTDAASTPVTATTQKVKYDAVYSVCGYMHSADQVPVYIERDNHLSPMLAIYSYFSDRGINLNRATGEGEPEPVRVTMLKNPAHGELIVRNKAGTSFTYLANPVYLGSDQMVFEVEILSKKFKVIQTVIVHNSGNPDFPTDAAQKELYRLCPSYNRSSLDIIELPTDGFAADEELANRHSMLSLRIIGDRPRFPIPIR